MKKINRFYISIFYTLFLLPSSIYAQDWPKIFGEDIQAWSRDIIETYDKGYVIIAQVDPIEPVPRMYAWLIKTDINGNRLWDKKIFSSSYHNACNGIEHTTDGGIILTGVTTKLDTSNWDVMYIKLNACGEKEWCNILSTPGNPDYGLKIKQVPDGYIALAKYLYDWETQRIWLVKMDGGGNVLWEKVYAQQDTNIFNEECRGLLVTSDGGYLITGDTYYLEPGGHYGYAHPLIIKTDADGNEQWVLPFGLNTGYKGNYATHPAENAHGFFYATGTHFRRDTLPLGDAPCFIKFAPSGQEISYCDLLLNTSSGGTGTLNLMDDQTLFISGAWTDSTEVQKIGIFKTDTIGNISKTKILFTGIMHSILGSIITNDKKYVATGGFIVNNPTPDIYLFKLNSDLEYDSIYTQPFTYDSLCPYAIDSDTLNLDDCIVTGIHEPSVIDIQSNINIYPNPSNAVITIDIPATLSSSYTLQGIQVTQAYHRWDGASLQVYDINGRMVKSEFLSGQSQTLTMDVSAWQPGMYLLRIVYKGKTLGTAKMMKE